MTGSGEEAFEVHVSPEQPMVKHGGSQVINCSTNCTKPENGGLETSLDKIVLQDSPQWKLFMIFNVSQNSSMRCFFWCSRKQGSKSLNVGLYYPPKQVLLKLQPTRVAVGSPFTIECRVPSVAPLEGLTVTLLRGSEVLHSQTFEGTALSPQEAMVTYSAEAQLEDSSHNFSCQAKMDLRTRGVKVVDSVSDSQALEVFEPVQDNWMVIIVVVSVLLLFVTSVLLCFVFGQQGNQRRRGIYRVQAAWMRLRGTHPAQPA
ncbi:intercellular adhesion molecule 2-like isoform X2 [Camelus ferus]|uniref:Intercellular adhesion molecule 2-like isoform X2 n=2 Tax=Camelus TaxID=9836 RepID=A0A8B8R4X3_CAMFR|nr:intercellular adhesion molecule 2 isoform X2 [Camelus bactrianus]XP_032312972.1 intercellular adhesion molecule 2-like isoform X2 [Camelus ferus]